VFLYVKIISFSDVGNISKIFTSVFTSAIFSYEEVFFVALISKLKSANSICFLIDGIFL
jgi:hypothetical protein